jgi:aryl-alcohol dehydrogenase-like predicted oxidoreductase
MQYRTLGMTGIDISAISFGAGPVSELMTADDRKRQLAVITACLTAGINWFDTAATYGAGQSERNLGEVFEELGAASSIHVATKVRLPPEELSNIRGAVRRSIEGSLKRLRRTNVTLLQLHNSITARRGDKPTSVTPADVLGSGGIADAFEELRSEGLVSHLGLTGIGQPAALKEVIASRRFATMQVPYNLLNPSAGHVMNDDFAETHYGNVIASCARAQTGVLAIRVLAGGALAKRPPSSHTLKTPFFPLDLYERDRTRAARLETILGADRSLPQESIRFALDNPSVSSAIIGFAECWQVDEAVEALNPGESPVDWDELFAANSNVQKRSS